MPRRLSILAAPLAFALALTATTDRSHANEFVTAEGDAKPFVYRYHPVNPVDPFDTEAVEIDIVELAGAIGSNAAGQEDVLQALRREDRETALAGLSDDQRAFLETVYDEMLRGGVYGSFAGMAFDEIRIILRYCSVDGEPVESTEIETVSNAIRLHTNPDPESMIVAVRSEKMVTCERDGASIAIPLKRRWVIAVLSDLAQTAIDVGDFKYKMLAEGAFMQLIAYYSNVVLTPNVYQADMRLVTRIDPATGRADPRRRYYDVRPAGCLDILFKFVPENDQSYTSLDPDDLLFCARGCIPGDVSATR